MRIILKRHVKTEMIIIGKDKIIKWRRKIRQQIKNKKVVHFDSSLWNKKSKVDEIGSFFIIY